jgi:hypothetical protein
MRRRPQRSECARHDVVWTARLLLLLQRCSPCLTGVAFMLIGESLEDLQHRHEPLR